MIYLVRHGETEFNRERRLQGHVDSPLTERGLAQARAVGRTLAGLAGGPDGWRLVTSPLGRARRTAQVIAEALGGAEVAIEPRLIELSWGEWDGRLRDELAAAHPDTFGRTNWAFHAPTGETYEAMCARLSSWLSDLPPEPDRRVIAVSHGVTGRILRGVYAGLDPDEVVTQDVPQDAVYRLSGGAIERIDCVPDN